MKKEIFPVIFQKCEGMKKHEFVKEVKKSFEAALEDTKVREFILIHGATTRPSLKPCLYRHRAERHGRERCSDYRVC